MNSSRDVDPARLSERLATLPGLERLREAAEGMPAYLVGGAVRDILLGEPSFDIDVVVEGDVGALAAKLGGEVREHDRFATATVRDGELSVDLASSRAESYPSPGRSPRCARRRSPRTWRGATSRSTRWRCRSRASPS